MLVALASVAATLLLMLLWFVVSLVFRRRFQFGIRSLLLLTVVIAIPCSWFAAAGRRQGNSSNWWKKSRMPAGGFDMIMNSISLAILYKRLRRQDHSGCMNSGGRFVRERDGRLRFRPAGARSLSDT